MSSARRDQPAFDLAVLGGGSAGLAGALRAARHGARVVLLEPAALGGTCVNAGCVPKKAMWLAADLATRMALAPDLGFQLQAPVLDWPVLVAQRQRYIQNIHRIYQDMLDQAGVVWMAQRGRLRDGHTIETDNGLQLHADKVMIATGGRPVRPPIPGQELAGVSDDFFHLCAAPARVALVGGGVVAVELAGVLQALGSQVHVFARGPRLLPGHDGEVVAHLQACMVQHGVHLHLDSPVTALSGQPGQVHVSHAGSDTVAGAEPFDQVLLVAGRKPNSRQLGLEALGVDIGENDAITVDDYQYTGVAGIHAVGDVTARVPLTPVAVAAARRLMDRLYGGQADARLDYDNIPSVVFAHPPLGSVGMTEEQARKAHGAAVSVHTARFRPMLTALVDSPQRSLFKLVCVGAEQKVVGIHLLGEAADEILQGFALALKLGLTKRQFEEVVAIHPTSAEEVVLMH
jgi:glutathione reductase (NADPH)